MEEKQIVDGAIGSVGKYDLDFKEGGLVLEVAVMVGPLQTVLNVKLDAGAVLDTLAKAIPGTFDDAIIGVAKAALLGK